MIVEHAPAKINLSLHVTGQRRDGYHMLDSLVGFATVADRLTLTASEADGFRVDGPFAQDLVGETDNLVLRACALLKDRGRSRAGGRRAFSVTLEKNLPVASGLGGGSADAAAALRMLNAARGLGLDPQELQRISQALGADLPMCVTCGAARVSGIGEIQEPVSPFPPLAAILVNPRVEVPTPAVFRGLADKTNPPMPPLGDCNRSPQALIDFLRLCRNDLEAPARRVAPAIGAVLAALDADPSCRLARMSGSGATCFGLFDSASAAGRAGERLAADNPGWWVRACRIENDPFAIGIHTRPHNK